LSPCRAQFFLPSRVPPASAVTPQWALSFAGLDSLVVRFFPSFPVLLLYLCPFCVAPSLARSPFLPSVISQRYSPPFRLLARRSFTLSPFGTYLSPFCCVSSCRAFLGFRVPDVGLHPSSSFFPLCLSLFSTTAYLLAPLHAFLTGFILFPLPPVFFLPLFPCFSLFPSSCVLIPDSRTVGPSLCSLFIFFSFSALFWFPPPFPPLSTFLVHFSCSILMPGNH